MPTQILGSVRFDVSPPPARKSLKIQVPPGFRVIGDQVFGQGDATMTLRASGYSAATLTIALTPGRTFTRYVDLTPSIGASAECATLDVDTLMSKAELMYNSGLEKPALSLVEQALGCKQTDEMYRAAAMYACGAYDEASARRYYRKVPLQLRPAVELRCKLARIDLRTEKPALSRYPTPPDDPKQ